MPWGPEDASSKTKKAKSPKRKRQWSKVANKALAAGASEGRAIRQANTAVKKSSKKKRETVKHRGKKYTFR